MGPGSVRLSKSWPEAEEASASASKRHPSTTGSPSFFPSAPRSRGVCSWSIAFPSHCLAFQFVMCACLLKTCLSKPLSRRLPHVQPHT